MSTKLTEDGSVAVLVKLAGLSVKEDEVEALLRDMGQDKINGSGVVGVVYGGCGLCIRNR